MIAPEPAFRALEWPMRAREGPLGREFGTHVRSGECGAGTPNVNIDHRLDDGGNLSDGGLAARSFDRG
jgi:hypothetical protein